MEKAIYEKHHPPITHAQAKKLYPKPHFHNEIEIVYVIDGQSDVIIDNNFFTIKSGDFSVSFPNQVHCYRNAQEGKYIVMILTPTLFFNCEDTLFKRVPKTNLLSGSADEEMTRLFVSASATGKEYDELIRSGILSQAFGLMLEKMELVKRVDSDNSTLREVLNYCSLNYASDLSLDKISEALHINKYHISHLFNNKLNLRFNTYINTIRVDAATAELARPERKIAEISEDVGFGSIRSFNRAFMEIKQMTPLEYRNHIKAKKKKE